MDDFCSNQSARVTLCRTSCAAGFHVVQCSRICSGEETFSLAVMVAQDSVEVTGGNIRAFGMLAKERKQRIPRLGWSVSVRLERTRTSHLSTDYFFNFACEFFPVAEASSGATSRPGLATTEPPPSPTPHPSTHSASVSLSSVNNSCSGCSPVEMNHGRGARYTCSSRSDALVSQDSAGRGGGGAGGAVSSSTAHGAVNFSLLVA